MDKYQVRLLPLVYDQLDELYCYIATHFREPMIAMGYVDTIEEGILALETMPYRNPKRRTGAYANRGYRQLFVKNYTIVYRIEETTKEVVVVTVNYSRSEF